MGRTHVREQLTEYAPNRALAYDLDGAAGPFLHARSRWSTRECEDGSTELLVEGFFVPRNWLSRIVVWPLVKPMIRRLTNRVVSELERYLSRDRATA